MTWLLTNSGKHLDLIDPQPAMIDILDIAKGLSREARFSGQTPDFPARLHKLSGQAHVAQRLR